MKDQQSGADKSFGLDVIIYFMRTVSSASLSHVMYFFIFYFNSVQVRLRACDFKYLAVLHVVKFKLCGEILNI